MSLSFTDSERSVGEWPGPGALTLFPVISPPRAFAIRGSDRGTLFEFEKVVANDVIACSLITSLLAKINRPQNCNRFICVTYKRQIHNSQSRNTQKKLICFAQNAIDSSFWCLHYAFQRGFANGNTQTTCRSRIGSLGFQSHRWSFTTGILSNAPVPLRTVAGRGRAAAKMTAIDAANLVIAVTGSESVKNSVWAVLTYGGLRGIKTRTTATGIRSFDELPANHSLAEMLAALIDAVAVGELLPDKFSLTVRLYGPRPYADLQYFLPGMRNRARRGRH